MLRGLYTAAAGMMTQQRIHDTVTNNISNMYTPGYKQTTTVARSFPEMLLAAMGTDQPAGFRQMGNLHTGVFGEESISIHLQGELQQTDNPFDFALVSNIQVPGMTFDRTGKYVDEEGNRTYQPHAFFTVLNEQGERRYTLDGKFSVNPLGQLVTSSGHLVLGDDDQPIRLVDASDEPLSGFTVSSTGLFFGPDGEPLDNANGEPLRLLLTKAEDPNLLVREGHGVFRIEAEDEATLTPVDPDNPDDAVQVRQGYTERSNVDPTQAVVDMMLAARAYEANQKLIQYYDRSLDKAVNEIGRI